MRSNFIRRNSGALTLRNQVRTSDLRLPLEGGATSIAPTAPHPSRAAARATFPQGKAIFSPRRNFSRGMTATGSHIDFGFAARGTTPRGRLFLCPSSPYADFYRSDIAAQRARHASPLQCHAGTFHRPYRAPPGDLRFSSKNHHRPRKKSRGRWLQKERGKL